MLLSSIKYNDIKNTTPQIIFKPQMVKPTKVIIGTIRLTDEGNSIVREDIPILSRRIAAINPYMNNTSEIIDVLKMGGMGNILRSLSALPMFDFAKESGKKEDILFSFKSSSLHNSFILVYNGAMVAPSNQVFINTPYVENMKNVMNALNIAVSNNVVSKKILLTPPRNIVTFSDIFRGKDANISKTLGAKCTSGEIDILIDMISSKNNKLVYLYIDKNIYHITEFVDNGTEQSSFILMNELPGNNPVCMRLDDFIVGIQYDRITLSSKNKLEDQGEEEISTSDKILSQQKSSTVDKSNIQNYSRYQKKEQMIDEMLNKLQEFDWETQAIVILYADKNPKENKEDSGKRYKIYKIVNRPDQKTISLLPYDIVSYLPKRYGFSKNIIKAILTNDSSFIVSPVEKAREIHISGSNLARLLIGDASLNIKIEGNQVLGAKIINIVPSLKQL
jgi:hypothetical protein